jgi:hypothetical protein
MVDAIDGRRTIAGIIEYVAASKPVVRPADEQVRSRFQRLWCYDQIVFASTPQGGNASL